MAPWVELTPDDRCPVRSGWEPVLEGILMPEARPSEFRRCAAYRDRMCEALVGRNFWLPACTITTFPTHCAIPRYLIIFYCRSSQSRLRSNHTAKCRERLVSDAHWERLVNHRVVTDLRRP